MHIPYGKGYLEFDLEPLNIKGVLQPKGEEGVAPDEASLIENALQNPIGSLPLCELARGKKNILVIASDHTRPVPSRLILPPMLREIRMGNPEADIKIVVATGFHRPTSGDELRAKFGEEILNNEEIVIHRSEDHAQMVYMGLLPSGGELWLNRLVDWAELIVSEGFIEPHFFAGFSGGRKSVLPGIASTKTVFANHCSKFIADPLARTGILEGNPIHKDMVFAAKEAGLAFIVNVVLNADKRVIAAYAGDPFAAHAEGCRFVLGHSGVRRVAADIVITSNGGYPLDQNIYQAVKGMTAAEACVRPGGVIIMCAECSDGHGGEGFYRWFAEARDAREVAEKISRIPQHETLPDQWEAQILARVLLHARVIMVCDPKVKDLVREMKMEYAATPEEAVRMACGYVDGREAVVIPDGVGVIVQA